MSNIVEAKNEINDKGSSASAFQKFANKFDIGITMLQNRRDKITNGGKYNERYQDTFAEKKGYPLSARYKDIYGRLRQVPNSEGSSSGSSDSSSVASSSDKSKRNPSPVSSPKFDKPVKLSTIINGSPTKNRNATQDLNKTSNMAQLTSFRLVSEVKRPIKNNKGELMYIKPHRLHDENDQVVNKIEQQPPDTMELLQNAGSIISKLEADEKRRRNIQKFNEICKNLKPDVKNEQKDVSQELREEPRKNAINIESLAPPLKSFNEVENFLKPGVSDMEAENTENFERGTKVRSSTGYNERQEKNKSNKNKPLSRAASDAQDHKIPDRTAPKPKPRNRIYAVEPRITKEVFCFCYRLC